MCCQSQVSPGCTEKRHLVVEAVRQHWRGCCDFSAHKKAGASLGTQGAGSSLTEGVEKPVAHSWAALPARCVVFLIKTPHTVVSLEPAFFTAVMLPAATQFAFIREVRHPCAMRDALSLSPGSHEVLQVCACMPLTDMSETDIKRQTTCRS
jgi:hypothetical protein